VPTSSSPTPTWSTAVPRPSPRSAAPSRPTGSAPPLPPALPSSSHLRLADGVEAFHEIRETLRAGGLGRIDLLAPPEPPGRPASPGPADVVNPDSETVDLPTLLATLALAGAASA
jgi:hypothetical protein